MGQLSKAALILLVLSLLALGASTQVNAVSYGPRGTLPEDNHPMAQFVAFAD